MSLPIKAAHELDGCQSAPVIYLGGGGNPGISPLTGFAPLKFSNYHNKTCNFYQKTIFLALYVVYEATRSSLRGHKFHEGACSLSMLPHAIIPPLCHKILYKTLHVTHNSLWWTRMEACCFYQHQLQLPYWTQSDIIIFQEDVESLIKGVLQPHSVLEDYHTAVCVGG